MPASCRAATVSSTAKPSRRARATVIAVSELLWHDTQPAVRRNCTSPFCSSGRLRRTASAGDWAGADATAGCGACPSSAPAAASRSVMVVVPFLRASISAVSPFGPRTLTSAPRASNARTPSTGKASDAAARRRIGYPALVRALTSAPAATSAAVASAGPRGGAADNMSAVSVCAVRKGARAAMHPSHPVRKENASACGPIDLPSAPRSIRSRSIASSASLAASLTGVTASFCPGPFIEGLAP